MLVSVSNKTCVCDRRGLGVVGGGARARETAVKWVRWKSLARYESGVGGEQRCASGPGTAHTSGLDLRATEDDVFGCASLLDTFDVSPVVFKSICRGNDDVG